MAKKKRLAVSVGFGVILLVLLSASTNADSTQPGSADDPLVTKSYVDQAIAQKLGGVTATPVPSATPIQATPAVNALTETQVRAIVEAELAKVATPSPSPTPTSASDSPVTVKLEVVVLHAEQTLMAGAGTEFIVRTGKAIAVSNDENGIPDVTAGKDIQSGSAIDLNHLLIFPREGRGIKPDPKEKNDIYVMVRGSYLLTKP